LSVNPAAALNAIALALLLQACAATPGSVPENTATTADSSASAAAEPAAVGEPVPELNLNLPSPEQCVCVAEEQEDYTFLEKGYRELLDGEYVEAVQHFQRYQRLESSPRANLEAGIAIAYVSMLPRSPFYDPEAVRRSFKELRKQNPKQLKVHEMTRLMRQSLINLLILQDHVDDLENLNGTLREDLEKREDALKRLRKLTLGQK
jgi:TolA-binding protein